MVVLRSEDCGATKVELAAAEACEGASVPKMDPDIRMAAARERVSRLEKALTALGDVDGVEVDSSRAASPEGGTGSACRSPNPREGGFLRTGKETDRPNR